MKILGQDENGRIVIDGEGVEVEIGAPIPGDSPVVLKRFVFKNTSGSIELKVTEENTSGYKCSVCDTPMKVKGQCKKCEPPEPFHPEYFWAFVALLLGMRKRATGEEEVFISVKQLQRFPIDEAPLVYWSAQLQGWIMKNRPQKPAIVEQNKAIVTA